ncbi:type II secretion system F family protein [Nocardioides sp. J2M5]|uniref:type II secretion system F family protein n=1 Tax=Nocardioides palaemonis TaxID=2829810 RepID=UPI001BA9C8D6|nr:type II secretion system F family protein [Nocardioides palaemonis]MBS2939836.1 type II secretion system F family protein [Nocardioides palaemonis]
MTWVCAGCVLVTVWLLVSRAPEPWSGQPTAPGAARAHPAGRRWPRALAALGAGAGAWALVGGRAGVAASVVAAVASWWVLARAEPAAVRREREEVERTLPHLVDLFAATLRGGADPVGGLALVCRALPGPAADRLSPVVDHARWGAPLVDAWATLADDEALAPLGRAMERAQASGASVVQVIERLADELERESAARAEDAARRVGVAAALPLGICLLPAFLLLGVVPTAASLLGSLVP